MAGQVHRPYLPAFRHDQLLPFYDPLVSILGADDAREQLIDHAGIEPGQRVLDVGCGTGTLVLALKRQIPGAEVHGLDPDPKALSRATGKAARAALYVQLKQGLAGELPYADGFFDRLFCSYVFHHLSEQDKHRALSEMRRVLKPSGILNLLDFRGPDAAPRNLLERFLHSRSLLKSNTEPQVLAFLRAAGFAKASRVGLANLRLGQVAYYQARPR